MALSRRTFLSLAIAGATLVAAGGAMATLALQPTVPRSPKTDLKVLSAQQYAIFLAVAERMIVPAEGAPSVVEANVVEGIDAVLATMPKRIVDELGTGLWLLENALTGAALDGRITTFSGSAKEEQDRVLMAWSKSSLNIQNLIYRGLHQLIVAVYWSDPRTNACLGYDGPPDYGQRQAPKSPRRFDERPPTSTFETEQPAPVDTSDTDQPMETAQ
ncbi:MAG: hypothetical protein ACI9MC_001350 [Kiritimatiellia bacterium]|jgi:hypothetical protein